MGLPRCNARHAGHRCSLRDGHLGADHVTHDPEFVHLEVARWPVGGRQRIGTGVERLVDVIGRCRTCGVEWDRAMAVPESEVPRVEMAAPINLTGFAQDGQVCEHATDYDLNLHLRFEVVVHDPRRHAASLRAALWAVERELMRRSRFEGMHPDAVSVLEELAGDLSTLRRRRAPERAFDEQPFPGAPTAGRARGAPTPPRAGGSRETS